MIDTIIQIYLNNLFNLSNYILTIAIIIILCFYGYAKSYYKYGKKLIIPLTSKSGLKPYIYGIIHSSIITTFFSYNVNEIREPILLVLLYPLYYFIITFPNFSILEPVLFLSWFIGFMHFQENYSSPIYQAIIFGYYLTIEKEINPKISFCKIKRY